jgi:endonuclease YncB( thermonuclease family)
VGLELARQTRPRSCIAAFAFVLVLATSAGAEDFQRKVVGIADGDTITVLRNREPVRVRLNGIDAPEKAQPFATRAKEFTSSLAFGKVVTARVKDRDRYGRLVADVILPDGRNLNHELVRAGFAWWFRRYAPNDRALADLEAEAREAKRGLWADPKPVPPWEWRATKRH